MGTSVLYYSAHPHIIELILSHIPYSALGAVGATCKGLRASVAAIQSQHLILSPLVGDELLVRTPLGRLPGLYSIIFRGDMAKELARIKLFTDHTTVLDVQGFVGGNINLTRLAPAFPNLETYRAITDPLDQSFTPYFPLPCKTLVIFYNEDGPNPGGMRDADDFDSDYEDFDDEDKIIPEGVIPAVPEGVRKTVVNMKGDDVPVADFFPCIFNFPTSVQDFVIVFPFYELGKARGRFFNFTAPIIVMDTVELVGTDAMYTLVGLDEASRGFNMLQHMRAQLGRWEFTGDKSKQECINERLDHVRIRTKAEYAKSVKDIELETVEHIYRAR